MYICISICMFTDIYIFTGGFSWRSLHHHVFFDSLHLLTFQQQRLPFPQVRTRICFINNWNEQFQLFNQQFKWNENISFKNMTWSPKLIKSFTDNIHQKQNSTRLCFHRNWTCSFDKENCLNRGPEAVSCRTEVTCDLKAHAFIQTEMCVAMALMELDSHLKCYLVCK